MSLIRRAPKFHHYWCLFSTMPPTKHRRNGSPLIAWLTQRTGCDPEAARLAFESAKQARYLIQNDGKWTFDANTGFNHWNKPKAKADAPAPAPSEPAAGPELPAEDLPTYTPEQQAKIDAANARMAARNAEAARLATSPPARPTLAELRTQARTWPPRTGLDAVAHVAQLMRCSQAEAAPIFAQINHADTLTHKGDSVQGVNYGTK